MNFDVATPVMEENKKPVLEVMEVQNEVQNLVKVEPKDPEVVAVGKAISTFVQGFDITKSSLADIEKIGNDLMGQTANKSKILNVQIKEFQQNAGEGSPIARQLMKLEENIGVLDPNSANLERKGLIAKLFNPIKKYFEKFETVNSVITNITNDLDVGSKRLQQDNIVMEEDSKNMIKLTKSVSKQIEGLSYAKEEIERYVSTLTDVERKNFIESEILFTISQKIIDMETLKNVAIQAVMAMGVLIRNNKELIKQVARTKNITMFALQTSIVICKALLDQKAVIEATKKVSETTNKLIAESASRLKQQGAEIHKQASTSVVDINTLKQAFADINSAIDDIKTYRQQALPAMNQVITEFDSLSRQAEGKIAEANNRLMVK